MNHPHDFHLQWELGVYWSRNADRSKNPSDAEDHRSWAVSAFRACRQYSGSRVSSTIQLSRLLRELGRNKTVENMLSRALMETPENERLQQEYADFRKEIP